MANKPSGGLGVAYGSLAFGDVDNDGDQDLAVMGQVGSDASGYKLFILKNNLFKADGSIESSNVQLEYAAAWDLSGLHGTRRGDLQLADMNNDGYLDLIVTGRGKSDGSTSNVRLFLNTQNRATPFVEPLPALEGISSDNSSLAVADYDNDGDLDILLNASGNNSRIYINN